MPTLEALYEIYEKFEQTEPGTDACNQAFLDAVEEWTAAFSASQPGPAEAADAVNWILKYPRHHREEKTFRYSCAAQKQAEGLIPFLAPEAAARILTEFVGDYPKADRTPLQEHIQKELSDAAALHPAESGPKKKTLLWGKRVAVLLLGLAIAHLGVTLFLLADLGSDPFNVMIQGLFRMVSSTFGVAVTHGTVHILVSLLIILVLLAVDRSYVRIGTFLCMILGGPIIDVFTVLLQALVNQSSAMAVRLIAVVLGCAILAFGMTIVIKSEAGTGPNDLVAVVISEKRRWKFGPVRIAVDLCFAGIGFLLGGTLGIGTIVCLAVVGPVAQVFMPFSEKLCRKMIG
ncbi:MAG: YitT family protein [Oscillospiraceae bacterium]|nr:YitT family protein [Oscillospiraceae bacterium]